MLLILIRKYTKRHKVYGKLYLANSYHPIEDQLHPQPPTYRLGSELPDRDLIYICNTKEDQGKLTPELYYHLGIPALSRLGITSRCLRALEHDLRLVMASGEEVYLNITHFVPEYPGYPRVNYDPRVDLRRSILIDEPT